MQQWYEFTTTKGTAGLSMYINITTTAKGLNSVDLIAGKACYLAELSYISQLRQGNFILSILAMPGQLTLSIGFGSCNDVCQDYPVV